MSDDKNKNIPTLEDIIHPGDLNKAVIGDLSADKPEQTDEPQNTATEAAADTPSSSHTDDNEHDSTDEPESSTADTEQAAETDEASAQQDTQDRRVADRRAAERRVSSQPLPENKIERRIAQRRERQRRETDKQFSLDLGQLVEKIMLDMMPDIEQHIRLQLRFELEKHLPRSVFENRDKD